MSNPTKFVLMSHGRAGTNFLMNNLAAHPDIQVHNEPFQNNPAARLKVRGTAWEPGTSARAFAYEHLFVSPDTPVKAAGFKLFYFHCRQPGPAADIWPALLEDRDVRVVFLNRKNLLNKHLSDLRAQTSGTWHPKTDNYMESQYRDVTDIRVKIPEAMQVLTSLYCGYHRTAELFRDHPNCHYFYEDLETRGEDILGEVFDFLDVPRIPMRTSFRVGTLSRQTTRIVNEEALRARLEASLFSDFVQTCPLL